MRFLRKTICCVLLALMVCASVVGCSIMNEIEIKSTLSEQCETANNWEFGTMDKTLREIENTPLDDLTSYECRSFTGCLYPQGFVSTASTSLNGLEALNNAFPVERIERINKDYVFAVYKIEQDGKEAFLRIMLKRSIERIDGHKQERWGLVSSYFIESGDYKHADFSDIKEGDNALEVAAIDDTLEFDLQLAYGGNEGKSVFSSRKLLDDGVLIITYEATNAEDGSTPNMENYTVVDIYFDRNIKSISALMALPHRGVIPNGFVPIWVWILVAAAVLLAVGAVIVILIRRRRKKAAQANP